MDACSSRNLPAETPARLVMGLAATISADRYGMSIAVRPHRDPRAPVVDGVSSTRVCTFFALQEPRYRVADLACLQSWGGRTRRHTSPSSGTTYTGS